MFCRVAITVAVLGGSILLPDVAQAESRRGRAPRPRLRQPPAAARPLDQQETVPVLRQPHPYSHWRELYPQFYGGFHYRQIYEFGPPGDFGFRGSPW